MKVKELIKEVERLMDHQFEITSKSEVGNPLLKKLFPVIERLDFLRRMSAENDVDDYHIEELKLMIKFINDTFGNGEEK
jgi:hypothetical protein